MTIWKQKRDDAPLIMGHRYAHLENGKTIDLTLMFGEGNEPRTKSDIRAKLLTCEPKRFPVQISVSMMPELADAASEQARALGISRSEYIRQCIIACLGGARG